MHHAPLALIVKDWWPTHPAAISSLRGGTAILGNFDGLHRGHRVIIESGLKKSDPCYLLSFEPHSREFFQPQEKIRLTSLTQKARILYRFGLKHLVVLPFHQGLSKISAQDFVSNILCSEFQVKNIVCGSNFRFGHRRAGDEQMLKIMGKEHGFGVMALPPVEHESLGVYSSSKIRHAIRQGDMVQVFHLMGRFFEIEGKVIKGDQRGRLLGFPTANMESGMFCPPKRGVYQVEVETEEGQIYGGIANYGTRPTADGTSLLLETHLFDFSEDIYNKILRVRFCAFIRPERKFDSLDALKTQIAQDIAEVKKKLRA